MQTINTMAATPTPVPITVALGASTGVGSGVAVDSQDSVDRATGAGASVMVEVESVEAGGGCVVTSHSLMFTGMLCIEILLVQIEMSVWFLRLNGYRV